MHDKMYAYKTLRVSIMLFSDWWISHVPDLLHEGVVVVVRAWRA